MCGEERRRETALAALPGWHEEEREEDDDGEEERGIDVPRVGTADKWYGNIRVSQTVSSKATTFSMLNLQSGPNSLSLDPHLAITLGLIRIGLPNVF